MRIKRIKIDGLTKHKNTDITLPEQGVVLITGGNGSSKTSIVEAVSVAYWNKSLRGTDLWARDGEVSVETYDGETITRKRKGSRTTVEVSGHAEYQTAAKATKEVTRDLSVWQRACVFAGEDVQSFAKSTDAERKKMLETVLGITRFDDALKTCKDELKAARQELSLKQSNKVSLENQLQQTKENLELLELSESAARPEGDLAALKAQLEPLNKAVKVAKAAADPLDAKVSALRDRSKILASQISSQQQNLAKLEKGTCYACHRELPTDGEAISECKAEIAKLDVERVAVQTEGKAAVAELALADAKVSAKTNARDAVVDAIRAHETFERNFQATRANQEKLRTRVTELKSKLAPIGAEVATAQSLVDELEACEDVLSVKGLRGFVLTEALTALESSANYWLAQFAPGVSLSIKPYKELKSGKVSEEISIELTGVAGGNGYKGSSRGERRRQDVAITLALGEVEAAASGMQHSTLFLDEPMESLDDAGVTALCDAIEEIRSKRCVVLITHSQEIIRSVRPDVHYVVNDGIVTRK